MRLNLNKAGRRRTVFTDLRQFYSATLSHTHSAILSVVEGQSRSCTYHPPAHPSTTLRMAGSIAQDGAPGVAQDGGLRFSSLNPHRSSLIAHPSRMVGWALAILASAVMLLSSPDAALAKKGGRGKGSRPTISNLNPQQREKLQKHVREAQGRVQNVRTSLRDARLDLYRRFGDYDLNEKDAQSSIRRINDLQLKLLKLNLENQVKLRDVLTREQFESLSEAIEDRDIDREDAGAWPGDGGPGGGNIDRLGLSSQQRERIEKLWRSSRENTSNLGRRLRDETAALQRLYMEYNLNEKQALSRIDRISDIQLALLKATVARQMELRKILNERQFEALSKSVRPSGPGPRGKGRRGADAGINDEPALILVNLAQSET